MRRPLEFSGVAMGIAFFTAATLSGAAAAPDWVARARATAIAPQLLAGKPAPDAIVLWQQQIVTAGGSTGSTKLFERRAVKILTSNGDSAGTFSSSYDDDSKVDVEGAWTLHADGAAEELKLRNVVSTQVAHPEYFTDTHVVLFRPPRLAPGDIASYALSRKSRRDVYQWVLRLQNLHPIAAQEIVVDLPDGWTHRWRLTMAPEGYSGPLTGEGGAKASYPFGPQRGVPEEEVSPPEPDRLASMEIAIDPPPGKFSELVFKSWKEVGAWFYRKSLPSRTDPPAELLASLPPSPADAGRWIQEKVRYVALEVGEGGFIPREPALVARRLYGDCKDKAFLFMALLSRRGFDVLPVLTRSRSGGSIDPAFPSPTQFNHLIVAVRVPAPTGLPAEVQLADGPAVVFDPTDTWTPYGQLPAPLARARGLVVRPDGAELIEFPAGSSAQNRLTRAVEAQITSAGRLTATVTDVTTGSLSQRGFYQEMKPVERTEWVQQYAQASIAGARASNVEFANLDDRGKPMEAKFSLSSDGYFRKTGAVLLLPVLPFSVGPGRIPRLDERRSPIDLGSPRTRKLTATFKLPPTLRVDALPDSVEVDNASFHYRFAAAIENGALVATETYEIKKPVVTLADLAAWKAIESAAAKAASSKAMIAAGD